MAQPMNITGDLKDRKEVLKEGVTLHNMPIVSATNLANAKHVLNERNVSGKRVGSLVTVIVTGKPVLLQAAGPEPTDLWIAVTKGGTDITPV